MMTRRHALKATALATAACATRSSILPARGQAAPGPGAPPAGPFALPPLPYPVDALEPHIDARTMEIHHDKHHAAYVANLNKAVAEFPELGNKPVEELLKELNTLPVKIRTAVRNQGGGHYNHTLFWQTMKKEGGGEPKGELAKAIGAAFGGFSGFKEKFTEAATKVFGSGWAWLTSSPEGQLTIASTPNQDSPLFLPPEQAEPFARRYGLKSVDAKSASVVLLGIDVWEHAYYLKYQNRRPEYIAAWFNVINWEFVAERYAKLKA